MENDTQKRIAEIRGSAALRDKDGRVDDVYADKAVRDDIPWLLEQLDEANHWRERHCTEAIASGKQSNDNWEQAKALREQLAERDAEIARLRSRLACKDCKSEHELVATCKECLLREEWTDE